MAPGHGFEPRLDDPESPVLPLDDPGMSFNNNFILALAKSTSINSLISFYNFLLKIEIKSFYIRNFRSNIDRVFIIKGRRLL